MRIERVSFPAEKPNLFKTGIILHKGDRARISLHDGRCNLSFKGKRVLLSGLGEERDFPTASKVFPDQRPLAPFACVIAHIDDLGTRKKAFFDGDVLIFDSDVTGSLYLGLNAKEDISVENDAVFQIEVGPQLPAASGLVAKPFISESAITSAAEDKLDFAKVARRLASHISSVKTPHVLGIYGKYGSGKTSLWQLTKEWLRDWNNDDIQILDVDVTTLGKNEHIIVSVTRLLERPSCWKQLLAGIIHSGVAIRYATAIIFGVALFSAVFTYWFSKSLQIGTAALFIAASGLFLSIESFLSFVERMLKQISTSGTLLKMIAGNPDTQLRGNFGRDVQNYIKSQTKKDTGRLVICVDNLDRCTPERSLEFLDDIQAFMKIDNLLWVLLFDVSIIESALRRKLERREDVTTVLYIEKILQTQVPVPTPRIKQFEEFVVDYFTKRLENSPALTGFVTKIRNDIKAATVFKDVPSAVVPRRVRLICEDMLQFTLLNGQNFNSENYDLLYLSIFLRKYYPKAWEIMSENTNMTVLTNLLNSSGALFNYAGQNYSGSRVKREEFSGTHGEYIASLVDDTDFVHAWAYIYQKNSGNSAQIRAIIEKVNAIDEF